MDKRTLGIEVGPDGNETVSLHILTPDSAPESCGTIILFLYGGSKDFVATKAFPLLEPLAERSGCIVVTFDYRGAPSTTRRFEDSGLDTRIADAKDAIAYLRQFYPTYHLVVWGHSMGGYVATRLTTEGPVRIVLSSPAAYDEQIVREHIPFGPVMTEILRKEGSWQRSDGPEHMNRFAGPSLMLVMRDDDIVKAPVTDMYWQHRSPVMERVILPFVHITTFDPTEQGATKRAVMIDAFMDWSDRP